MTDTQPVLALELEYQSTPVGEPTLTHRHRVRVKPDSGGVPTIVTPPDALLLEARGNGPAARTTVSAQIFAVDYINRMLAACADQMSLVSAQVMYYPHGLSKMAIVKSFIDLSDAVAFPSLSGGDGTAIDEAQQLTYTFVTELGRSARLVLIETETNGDNVFGIENLSQPKIDYVTFVTDSGSPIVGADGSHLLAFTRASETQNETVYRKRYR